jgi:signal peptidase I
MRKAAGVFGLVLLVLLMAMAVATFLAPHLGWRVDIVLSGSMESQLKAGGVVITRPVAANTIVPGDVITFYSPDTGKMTTHRVVDIETSPSLRFRTMGDVNEESDPFMVPAESVVGKVCFDVPYLGYVARFVKSPQGLLLSLCLPGLAVIAVEIKNIRRAMAERDVL